MWMFTLAISCLTTSNLPWFIALMFQVPYAILLFIASDFNSISSHIHNRVLFLQWLHLFILSGVISSLIFHSILDTYWPVKFIIQSPIFLPFHGIHGVPKAGYWSGLPFPSPVDHILSELSTMIHSSWVTLHSMAHSFTELDKAVVHVISLVSFQWLWFSFCLPSDR